MYRRETPHIGRNMLAGRPPGPQYRPPHGPERGQRKHTKRPYRRLAPSFGWPRHLVGHAGGAPGKKQKSRRSERCVASFVPRNRSRSVFGAK